MTWYNPGERGEGMKRYLGPLPALLFLLSLLLLLGCCGGCEMATGEDFTLPEAPSPLPQPGDGYITTLFYPDEQWRLLIPLQRELAETETAVRSTIEQLIRTPPREKDLAPLGLVPLLPEETAVLGIHIDESGPARVDLSGPFLGYDPDHERLILGGLLCTLRQFPEIERLEIMVEGSVPEKLPGGAPGGIPLGPECLVNLEVDDALEDYHNFTAVTVYFCFPTPAGRILYVPVTRALPSVEEHAAAALEELLAGPRRGSPLFSDIAPGTALRSLRIEEGVAIADLSGELLDYEGGRTGAENMAAQLLLTLGRLEGVSRVQILVEGEPVSLPEGIDLGAPLEPPALYNYY